MGNGGSLVFAAPPPAQEVFPANGVVIERREDLLL